MLRIYEDYEEFGKLRILNADVDMSICNKLTALLCSVVH